MKKPLALLLSLLLICASFGSAAWAEDEIPEGYTPIYTTEDLDNIRMDMDGSYILMNDLFFDEDDYIRGGDFYNSGKGWSPIGTDSAAFTGIFDGNGKMIVNLYINDPNAAYAGLFGAASGATIKNVTVTGNVTAASRAGLLLGKGLIPDPFPEELWKPITIDNCAAKGTVTATGERVGGLIGSAYWKKSITITNCHFDGTVTGGNYVGGIVGYAITTRDFPVTITGCLAEGTVNGAEGVGGIAGYIKSIGDHGAGSSNQAHPIERNENRSDVNGEKSVGGIVGMAESDTYLYTYITGNINHGSWSAYLYCAIADCFNRGSVTASTENAGGIVGVFTVKKQGNYYKVTDAKNSTMSRVYNIGAVQSEGARGGLASGGESYNIDAANTYYLEECVTDPTNVQGIAKSEDQLRKQATFEGWDFDTVWSIDKYASYRYPTLRGVSDRPAIVEPVACAHSNTELSHNVDATCTESGYTGDTVCLDCGKVVSFGSVIPALNHDYINHTAKAPTCAEGGWKAYRTCSRCDFSDYEALPATGEHTPGEPVEEVITPATCAKSGEKKITVTCSVCEALISETTGAIPPTGEHTPGEPVEEVITPATCAQAGEKKVTVTCSVCEALISETTEAIPATGEHTPGEPVEKIIKEPTCTEKGQKTVTVTCTVCGATLSQKTVAIPMLKHTDSDNDGNCDDCGQPMPAEEPSGGNDGDVCGYCGQTHTGPFGIFIKFIHNLLLFFTRLLRPAMITPSC